MRPTLDILLSLRTHKMMMQAFSDTLKKELKSSTILLDEPMSAHTSFKIGGVADVFVDVSIEDVPVAFQIAKEYDAKVAVLGNGSNILVGDKGIRGLTLSIGRNAGGIQINGERVFAGAGELLSKVSKECASQGLSGLEFASGIPGSLGGGVFMNAGAYDGELGDKVVKVVGFDTKTLAKVEYPVEECGFSYRSSRFQSEEVVVLSCELLLTAKNKDEILAKMEDFSRRRKEKQPLEYPSAGSTFKRPEGYFAGKLIEEAGLKGFSVGGAQVSEKHAGFVINTGHATAKDVRNLMQEIEERVYRASGVRLSGEVRFVGEF